MSYYNIVYIVFKVTYMLIITLFPLIISPLRPPLTIPPPCQPPGSYHEEILGSSWLFARPLGEGPDS